AQHVSRVDEQFIRGERATLDSAEHQEQDDEDDVDQGDCRLEEVVVVGGDELAKLVDKQSKTKAADDRCPAFGAFAQDGQQQHHGCQHKQPTPEEVGDVKGPAANPRI